MPDLVPTGAQITPWAPAHRLVAAAEVLSDAFDVVWVPDQMQARNVYAVLAAIAAAGRIGVGSGVTFPLSRNPIDLASAMATIGELAPPRRSVSMGMGAGGSLVASLFDKRSATRLLGESVELIRRLWAGKPVPLGEFPALGARLGWRPEATTRLTFAVTRPIPVLLAVGGPKTLRVAERFADGLICTSTYPPLSYRALGAGMDASAREIEQLAARRAATGWPLRLTYGLSCCVSADRTAARAFGRRQAALVVANKAVWPAIERLGLDLDSARAVRAGLDRGEGVDEVAGQVCDEILDAFVVAGGPDECVDRLVIVAEQARSAGFTEFYLGVPLGPDLMEAARILVGRIVPGMRASST